MLVWMTAGRLGFLPSSFDVLDAVRRIDRPVLFVGGADDPRMPIATVLDPLYDAAPSPLKRRLVVEGAGHGHAYDEDPRAYVAAVTDFLHSALPTAPAP
jgi:pimeloyl-ACP methyl ester carboxylesterase